VQETMLRAWTHATTWISSIAHLEAGCHHAYHLPSTPAGPAGRAARVKLVEDLAPAGGQRADASVDVAGVRAAIAALPGSSVRS